MLLVTTLATAGCSGVYDAGKIRALAAPSGSFAIVSTVDGNLAFLSSLPENVRLSTLSPTSGKAIASFSVGSTAAAVADNGASGFVVGYGHDDSGSIVSFGKRGERGAVMPLPGPVIALSSVVGNHIIALLATRPHRQALQIDLASGHVEKTFTFRATTISVALCQAASEPYLIADEGSDIVVHNLGTDKEIRFHDASSSVICSEDEQLHVIDSTRDGALVRSLSFPGGRILNTTDLGTHTIGIADLPSGEIAALDRQGTVHIIDKVRLAELPTPRPD